MASLMLFATMLVVLAIGIEGSQQQKRRQDALINYLRPRTNAKQKKHIANARLSRTSKLRRPVIVKCCGKRKCSIGINKQGIPDNRRPKKPGVRPLGNSTLTGGKASTVGGDNGPPSVEETKTGGVTDAGNGEETTAAADGASSPAGTEEETTVQLEAGAAETSVAPASEPPAENQQTSSTSVTGSQVEIAATSASVPSSSAPTNKINVTAASNVANNSALSTATVQANATITSLPMQTTQGTNSTLQIASSNLTTVSIMIQSTTPGVQPVTSTTAIITSTSTAATTTTIAAASTVRNTDTTTSQATTTVPTTTTVSTTLISTTTPPTSTTTPETTTSILTTTTPTITTTTEPTATESPTDQMPPPPMLQVLDNRTILTQTIKSQSNVSMSLSEDETKILITFDLGNGQQAEVVVEIATKDVRATLPDGGVWLGKLENGSIVARPPGSNTDVQITNLENGTLVATLPNGQPSQVPVVLDPQELKNLVDIVSERLISSGGPPAMPPPFLRLLPNGTLFTQALNNRYNVSVTASSDEKSFFINFDFGNGSTAEVIVEDRTNVTVTLPDGGVWFGHYGENDTLTLRPPGSPFDVLVSNSENGSVIGTLPNGQRTSVPEIIDPQELLRLRKDLMIQLMIQQWLNRPMAPTPATEFLENGTLLTQILKSNINVSVSYSSDNLSTLINFDLPSGAQALVSVEGRENVTATLPDGTVWKGQMLDNGSLVVRPPGSAFDIMISNLDNGTVVGTLPDGELTSVPDILDPIEIAYLVQELANYFTTTVAPLPTLPPPPTEMLENGTLLTQTMKTHYNVSVSSSPDKTITFINFNLGDGRVADVEVQGRENVTATLPDGAVWLGKIHEDGSLTVTPPGDPPTQITVKNLENGTLIATLPNGDLASVPEILDPQELTQLAQILMRKLMEQQLASSGGGLGGLLGGFFG